jgi:FG-GAP-like repeat/FG-GAP repeat
MLSGSVNPVSVSAADFNGDGKLDALLGFANGPPLLLSGDGNGGFGMPVAVLNVNGAQGVFVLTADLNHDGVPDALAADHSHGILSITLSPGKPQQSKNYLFNLDPGLSDIAVGDLNGDGLPDIVLVNSETDQITIFLSQN